MLQTGDIPKNESFQNLTMQGRLVVNRLVANRLKVQELIVSDDTTINTQNITAEEIVTSSQFVNHDDTTTSYGKVSGQETFYTEMLHQTIFDSVDLSSGVYVDQLQAHTTVLVGSTYVMQSINMLDGISLAVSKTEGDGNPQLLTLEIYDVTTSASLISGTSTVLDVTGEAPDYIGAGTCEYTFDIPLAANTRFVIRVLGQGDFTSVLMRAVFSGIVRVSTATPLPPPTKFTNNPVHGKVRSGADKTFSSCFVTQTLTCLPSTQTVTVNHLSVQSLAMPYYRMPHVIPPTITSLYFLLQSGSNGIGRIFSIGKLMNLDGFMGDGFDAGFEAFRIYRFSAPYVLRGILVRWFASTSFPDNATLGLFTMTVREIDTTTIIGDPVQFDTTHANPDIGFSTLISYTFPVPRPVQEPFVIGFQSQNSGLYDVRMVVYGVL